MRPSVPTPPRPSTSTYVQYSYSISDNRTRHANVALVSDLRSLDQACSIKREHYRSPDLQRSHYIIRNFERNIPPTPLPGAPPQRPPLPLLSRVFSYSSAVRDQRPGLIVTLPWAETYKRTVLVRVHTPPVIVRKHTTYLPYPSLEQFCNSSQVSQPILFLGAISLQVES